MAKTRIVVGMSGGVDSSVAALILKRAGYEVLGVFMNNWEEEDENGVCGAQEDWADVRAVCDAIDIPYYSVNFAKEYMERVFRHFLEEYERGRTPNPDVLCNREIKFGVLLDFARKLGAEKLATGHYARVGGTAEAPELMRAKDENKDQTYFLYMLNRAALGAAMFPLGGMTKPEVREYARANGLPTSEKRDSTGVCFIGERNFKRFLSGYLPATPGEMRTPEGRVVGRHDGLMYYTLGQRRGLGIGGGGDGRRWFVVGKDMARNVLLVEQGDDAPELYTTGALAEQASWIAGEAPMAEGESLRCEARFRHRQPLQGVEISREGGEVRIEFAEKQRAVTPGQSAVFYLGERCLGGAIIK